MPPKSVLLNSGYLLSTLIATLALAHFLFGLFSQVPDLVAFIVGVVGYGLAVLFFRWPRKCGHGTVFDGRGVLSLHRVVKTCPVCGDNINDEASADVDQRD